MKIEEFNKDNIIVDKRDGREDKYNIQKIYNALLKCGVENINIGKVLDDVEVNIIGRLNDNHIDVEKIHDIVEQSLKSNGLIKEYHEYYSYRRERSRVRQTKSDLIKVVNKLAITTDRDNANVGGNFSAKLLRIASETSKVANLATMPKDLAKYHENGYYHIHDLDSYNLTSNCLHNDTLEILKRGFNTGYGTINPPKRITSAAALSCIILQSLQNDFFGGQSCVDFDNAMGYYVPMTKDDIENQLTVVKSYMPKDEYDKLVNDMLNKAIHQAMQNVVYNLNTMHSRAGSQVPFSSLNIGLPNDDNSALVCLILLEEYDKGMGKGEQCIFPNIIFAVKDGINKKPGDPYYYLYEKACEVSGRHMNPTFMNVDSKINMELWSRGIRPAIMGCRTYVGSNINGQDGPSRRGNNAPITINLPRLGIEANHDISKFYILLDNMLEVSKESLLHRYNTLRKLKVKDLPFAAGQGIIMGSENLSENDNIDEILKNGTWGIGFCGLAETLVALTGKHHGEDPVVEELGYEIIKHIRDYCDKIKQELKMNFSCYASPGESCTGKFVKADRDKYGIIKGVTDRDYYTNSFHVPVYYKISIKRKLDIEGKFHYLCNGGHISYVEVDGYPSGQEVMKIINYAFTYTDTSYMGINFHMRYCKKCGKTVNEDTTVCTCGSTSFQGISRVTGYLALDERFGPSKVAERLDRVSHVNGENVYKTV